MDILRLDGESVHIPFATLERLADSNGEVGVWELKRQILVAEMVSVVQAVIAMMRSLLGKVFAGEEEIVVETADLWEEVTGLVLPVEEATEDMVGTEDMEDETSPHEEAIAGCCFPKILLCLLLLT